VRQDISTQQKFQWPAWLLYWASITPLVCGAMGPTVTLFALSGCVDRWRALEVNGVQILEPDPGWVVAATVTALVVGLAANLFMLLRMASRGNPKWNQNLSIILWFTECPLPLLPPGPCSQY
jgi:hypothetical protein